MIYLDAYIRGTPIPKDFHAARRGRRGRLFLLPSRPSLAWQKLLTDTLRLHRGRPPKPLDVPLWLALRFYLPAPAKRKCEDWWASRRPDLDKLCRAVLDALQRSGWVADDARVVSLHAIKRVCIGSAGVAVILRDPREWV